MTDLEYALNSSVAPWSKSNIVTESPNYVVFKDGFPVTEGHLLFVPTYNSAECIHSCFIEAYNYGTAHYADFNVGINHGVHAGQSVMYPHIHLIPRTAGDTPSPRGGVRHVIAGKGNYVDTQTQSTITE